MQHLSQFEGAYSEACSIQDDDFASECADIVRALREVLERRRPDAVYELFLRAKQLMYQSGGAPIENSLNPIDAFLYDAEHIELQERRKAGSERAATLQAKSVIKATL